MYHAHIYVSHGLSISNRDYEEMLDHSEIDDSETYLKTLPQIQTVIDNNVSLSRMFWQVFLFS